MAEQLYHVKILQNFGIPEVRILIQNFYYPFNIDDSKMKFKSKLVCFLIQSIQSQFFKIFIQSILSSNRWQLYVEGVM